MLRKLTAAKSRSDLDVEALTQVVVANAADLVAAVGAATEHTQITVLPGLYEFTAGLPLNNKFNLHIVAWGVRFAPEDSGSAMANRAVLEIINSDHITLIGAYVTSQEGETDKPACALLLARNQANEQAGPNYFYSCIFHGDWACAALINKGSEGNQFVSCEFCNQSEVTPSFVVWIGGGRAPNGFTLTTSETLGNDTTMLVIGFRGCWIHHDSTTPGVSGGETDACVLIDTCDAGGNTTMGNYVFDDVQFGTGASTPAAQSDTMKGVFVIKCSANLLRFVTIKNCRYECGGARHLVCAELDQDASGGVQGLSVYDNEGGTSEGLIFGEDSITFSSLYVNEHQWDNSSTAYNWGYRLLDGSASTSESDRRRSLVDVWQANQSEIILEGSNLAIQRNVLSEGLPANRNDPTADFTPWSAVHCRFGESKSIFRVHTSTDVLTNAIGGGAIRLGQVRRAGSVPGPTLVASKASISDDGALQIGGAIMSEFIGFYMPQAGSVKSINATITTGGGGNTAAVVNCDVRKGASTILLATPNSSEMGNSASAELSTDVHVEYTAAQEFAAGDVLWIYLEKVSGTLSGATAIVHVATEYHT